MRQFSKLPSSKTHLQNRRFKAHFCGKVTKNALKKCISFVFSKSQSTIGQVKCPDRHATDFTSALEIELNRAKIVSIVGMFVGKD
jgi:hypothetical protein